MTAQSEIEFGLPHRLQLDLYLIRRHEFGSASFLDSAVEMRYALADWGRLWGNPAVYLELTKQQEAPNKIEGKLLLGDSLGPGWRWGSNFSLEQEASGRRIERHGSHGEVQLRRLRPRPEEQELGDASD